MIGWRPFHSLRCPLDLSRVLLGVGCSLHYFFLGLGLVLSRFGRPLTNLKKKRNHDHCGTGEAAERRKEKAAMMGFQFVF